MATVFDYQNSSWGDIESYYNPPSSMQYAGLNDSQYASKTLAGIVEAQQQDYNERFKPYDEKLLSLANGTELLDEQLSRITASAKASQKRQANITNTLNSRLGVNQSALQMNSQNRQNALSSALGVAQAKNNMRTATSDLQDSILTGASGRSVLSTNQSY